MSSYRTFNMAKVAVVVGTVELKNFADGDTVTIERMSDTFTDSVGATGEVERAATNDRRGTITINIQQTALDNQGLSALMLLDEVSLSGVVPITVIDNSGFDVHTAAECWLVKPPSAVYGREAGKARTWVFRAADVDMFFGGNNK